MKSMSQTNPDVTDEPIHLNEFVLDSFNSSCISEILEEANRELFSESFESFNEVYGLNFLQFPEPQPANLNKYELQTTSTNASDDYGLQVLLFPESQPTNLNEFEQQASTTNASDDNGLQVLEFHEPQQVNLNEFEQQAITANASDDNGLQILEFPERQQVNVNEFENTAIGNELEQTTTMEELEKTEIMNKSEKIILVLSRKRKRNEEIWRCNIRKKNRQAGLEYTSTTGITIPARVGRPKTIKNCFANCRFKCATHISELTRLNIHVDFWQHSDDGKAHFYAQTVTKHRKIQGGDTRQKYSYKYSLFNGEKLVRVCKVFYLTTLNISQRRIEYALSVKMNAATGIVSEERRGRHPNFRAISEIRKQAVRMHIKSIPTVESHYRRASSKKEYLEAGLSISQLYAKYVEKCSEKILEAETAIDREQFTPVKEHIYRDIFDHEFNLEFHKPKQDRCDTCELFKNNKDDEKYKKHVSGKIASKAERDSDRSRIKGIQGNSNEAVICFDLQNVLSCPRANVSNFFYKRKLSMYHLTAHCSIDTRGYGAVWCETTSGRSGNDLASALIVILELILVQHPYITKITLWADSCVGQNRNSLISFALQNFLRSHTQIQSIEQKFCEPGHSSIQEVDNIHSHIEKVLKVREIFSPLSLIRALLKVTPKRPLIIRQLKDEDFKDYQSAAKKFKYSVVPYTRVKHIVYEKKKLWFRTSFNEDLVEAHILEEHSKAHKMGQRGLRTRNSTEIPSPNTTKCSVDFWPQPELLRNKPHISRGERDDILSMLKYMPPVDAAYMKSIVTKVSIQ